jgi:hypothetical protein
MAILIFQTRSKRLRAIGKALKDLYQGEPKGNLLKHLFTLAAII